LKSHEKLGVFGVDKGEVLQFLINQFYYQMMDDFAMHISGDAKGSSTIIFLHNGKQVQNSKLLVQSKLDKNLLLI
jgi:hypothetical protein